jgi:hypothetical protein
MNCLRPLKRWDRGFESHLKHGCLCAFTLFVLFCVQVAALRRADPPSKESYRRCIKIKKLRKPASPKKRTVVPQIDRCIFWYALKLHKSAYNLHKLSWSSYVKAQFIHFESLYIPTFVFRAGLYVLLFHWITEENGGPHCDNRTTRAVHDQMCGRLGVHGSPSHMSLLLAHVSTHTHRIFSTGVLNGDNSARVVVGT